MFKNPFLILGVSEMSCIIFKDRRLDRSKMYVQWSLRGSLIADSLFRGFSKAPADGPKRRKMLPISDKVKLLDMLREGKSYAAVARHYGINESSVRYIKKEEKNIRTTAAVNFNTFLISFLFRGFHLSRVIFGT